MNFDRLRHVAERASRGSPGGPPGSHPARRPGAFRRFAKVLGKRAVTEFNYYAKAGEAQVFVGVKVPSEDRPRPGGPVACAGYAVQDLTDNELAKVHVRHLVEGTAPPRFPNLSAEFPERPGALGQFLGAGHAYISSSIITTAPPGSGPSGLPAPSGPPRPPGSPFRHGLLLGRDGQPCL